METSQSLGSVESLPDIDFNYEESLPQTTVGLYDQSVAETLQQLQLEAPRNREAVVSLPSLLDTTTTPGAWSHMDTALDLGMDIATTFQSEVLPTPSSSPNSYNFDNFHSAMLSTPNEDESPGTKPCRSMSENLSNARKLRHCRSQAAMLACALTLAKHVAFHFLQKLIQRPTLPGNDEASRYTINQVPDCIRYIYVLGPHCDTHPELLPTTDMRADGLYHPKKFVEERLVTPLLGQPEDNPQLFQDPEGDILDVFQLGMTYQGYYDVEKSKRPKTNGTRATASKTAPVKVYKVVDAYGMQVDKMDSTTFGILKDRLCASDRNRLARFRRYHDNAYSKRKQQAHLEAQQQLLANMEQYFRDLKQDAGSLSKMEEMGITITNCCGSHAPPSRNDNVTNLDDYPTPVGRGLHRTSTV
jgi:hypothetical protein